MFKRCVVHYPTDEASLRQIYKEIASFRLSATVQYIESLNLNDPQIETLFAELENEIAAKRARSA